MLLEDEEFFFLKSDEKKTSSNNNLLQYCFDFCDIKDILNLSLTSKKIRELTQNVDYKFEFAIEKNFFSNYSNYE